MNGPPRSELANLDPADRRHVTKAVDQILARHRVSGTFAEQLTG